MQGKALARAAFAIAGFGAAAAAADLTHAARMHSLRERLETGLKAAAPQAVIAPSTQYHRIRGSRHKGGNRHNRL